MQSVIYRLYIRVDNGQIKYKDMNWNELITKVKQVMKHPRIIKFWIRHAYYQKIPGKYMIMTGTSSNPKMQIKWMN